MKLNWDVGFVFRDNGLLLYPGYPPLIPPWPTPPTATQPPINTST